MQLCFSYILYNVYTLNSSSVVALRNSKLYMEQHTINIKLEVNI